LELLGTRQNLPQITTINWFYDTPGFIEAAAGIAKPALEEFQPDHVLFSYHGLPEKQLRKSDPSGSWCLQADGCCERITPSNSFCYRAQSFATTSELVRHLELEEGSYSTTFQSRLAGQRWIEPHTDEELPKLYRHGVRRLAVLTPSFVADCLETLEEIGIRAREQWKELGGEDMLLVPCVNADPVWAAAAADLVRAAV
ncbi:MAG: ferrochelatase, partial [Acidimicrobiia bacterium]|nr:ferrochelatase [Acidimicrobiia bacterium]